MNPAQSEELTESQLLVKSWYKDRNGEPIILTPGQDELFTAISCKKYPRMHVMNHTRYGKSLIVALAVETRVSLYPEKWKIIAGTKEKARIIMNYLISHIYDNPITKQAFKPDKGESKNDIRRHMNKSMLNFVVGKDKDGNDLLSEVAVLAAGDALGEGAENIIEDESALISDDDHGFVMRMLGDNPHENFLCKIGNPFQRNHFLSSYHDPMYKKLVLNCYASLIDGRITWETIRENEKYKSFSVLFECLFPSQSQVDQSGWKYLFTDGEVSIPQQRIVQLAGKLRLGIDVARSTGGDWNTHVLRGNNQAQVLRKYHENNYEVIADNVIEDIRKWNIDAGEVYVDTGGGYGGGVIDILKMKGFIVSGISFGSKAQDDTKYVNTRAEIYDTGNVWLKQGGALIPHEDWIKLTNIRYRESSGGKMLLMSKDDMRKKGIDSPDIPDALMLTFAKSQIVHYNNLQQSNPVAAPYNVITGGLKPYIPGIG